MLNPRLAILGIVLAVLNLAETAHSQELLNLDLRASAKQGTSLDPLYVAIRLTNASQRDFELWEPFTAEYGDVQLYTRDAETAGFWDQVVLDPIAGRANDRRIVAKKLRPGEFLEVMEGVVPAAHFQITKERRIAFKAHFVRKEETLVSNVIEATIVPHPADEPRVVKSIGELLEAGIRPQFAFEKDEALVSAAGKADALARALGILKRCRSVEELSASRDARADIQDLAKLVETLPAVEREFWAIEIGMVHLFEAGRLLNRRDRVPAEVTFHLDIGTALDMSLGTAASNARWVRSTTEIYRKRLAEYVKQDADKRATPTP